MEFIFSPSALRNFEKLEHDVQERILTKIEFYFSQPHSLHFADKIKDARFGEWRFRIGDYRVLFDVEDNTAHILKLGHRREIYK